MKRLWKSIWIGRPDDTVKPWVDITEWVLEYNVDRGDVSTLGTENPGVDVVVKTMSMILTNEKIDTTWISFAPEDTASELNYDSGDNFDPLLGSMREIIIYEYLDDVGEEPPEALSDWIVLFHGYLGDDIKVTNKEVHITARDKAKRLQSAYVLDRSDPVTISGLIDSGDETALQITPEFGVPQELLFEAISIEGLTHININIEGNWMTTIPEVTFDVLWSIEYKEETAGSYTLFDNGATPITTSNNLNFSALIHNCVMSELPNEKFDLKITIEVSSQRIHRAVYYGSYDAYGNKVVEIPRVYPKEEDQPVWEILQEILDDNLATSPITIYTPNGTTATPIHEADLIQEGIVPMVYYPDNDEDRWGIEYETIWNALQTVVMQFGLFLGYKYHANTQAEQLVLEFPPIDKSIGEEDIVLDWQADTIEEIVDITDKHIRNYVKVYYVNVEGEEHYVEAINEASVAAFGFLAMEIELGETQLISTEAQAQAFADGAIRDLSDYFAEVKIELRSDPHIDVFYGIKSINPHISTTDKFYAVESVKHNRRGELYRTEVICSGKVITHHRKWLEMETRPGRAALPVRDRDWNVRTLVPAPRILDVSKRFDGAVVEIDRPRFTRWGLTKLYALPYNSETGVEASISPDREIAAQRSTQFRITETSNFRLNKEYQIVATNVDMQGHESDSGNRIEIIPGDIPGAVSNLVLNESGRLSGDGTWIAGIEVGWTASDSAVYEYAAIYMEDVEENKITQVARVEGVGGGNYAYEIKPLSLGEYKVWIISCNPEGLGESSDILSITLQGKQTNPQAISFISNGILWEANKIKLTYSIAAEADFEVYEVRQDLFFGIEKEL